MYPPWWKSPIVVVLSVRSVLYPFLLTVVPSGLGMVLQNMRLNKRHQDVLLPDRAKLRNVPVGAGEPSGRMPAEDSWTLRCRRFRTSRNGVHTSLGSSSPVMFLSADPPCLTVVGRPSGLLSVHGIYRGRGFFRGGPSTHLKTKFKLHWCCRDTLTKRILYLIMLIGFIIIRHCIICLFNLID